MEKTIPVKTWSIHNCSSSHRNANSFLKCCLNKYYYNGRNAHKPSIRIGGRGNWAVMKESWSETYYTEHNGRRNDQTHKIFEIVLFDSYEAVCEIFARDLRQCWDDDCRGGSCVNLKPEIVKVLIK